MSIDAMNNRFGSFTTFFLILLIFAIVIPMVIIQLVMNSITVQNLKRSIDQRLSEYAEAFVNSFMNECRLCEEYLYFARRVIFAKNLYQKEEIGSYFFDRDCRFYRVSLFDPNGKNLFSFLSNPDQTYLSPEPYEEFRELPPVEVSVDEYKNDTIIIPEGLVPIPGGYAQRTFLRLNDNKLLLADISFAKIFASAIKNLNLSSGSFISVLDESDALLYNSAQELSGDAIKEIRKDNLSGDYNFKDRTYRIKNFSLDTLPEICKSFKGLNFIVGIDYTDMLSGIRAGLGRGLLLTTFFTAFICVVFIFAGAYLRNKTGVILKRTDEIAQGDFDKEISVHFPSEFNRIAQNINQLSVKLKTLTSERIKSAKLSAIGRFAAHMVHDLRNPVYGISLLAYELKNTFSPDDPRGRYFNEIVNGIKKLGEIIDRIAEHGKIYEPNPREVEIDKLIKETVDEFKKVNPCEIDFLPGNVGIVRIDPDQWRRVFLNLFQNSYEAKKEDCRITIKTYRQNVGGASSPDTLRIPPGQHLCPSVIIEISDQSGGIPEHILPNIFEPFTTTKKKGLGLGLSFVKEIVEVHNGEIRLENNPGVGVKFIIIIPTNFDLSPSSSGDEEL
jgi:signal transduction histidine kinase